MLLAGGNGLSPRSMTSGSFSAQSAKVWKVDTAPGTSANIAFLMVPPPSRASISAISALRPLMISATARNFSARSLPDIRGHGPSSNALRAASTARWASSRPALATSAIFSPVDGAYVGKVSPDCASDQAPSMYSCVSLIAIPLRTNVCPARYAGATRRSSPTPRAAKPSRDQRGANTSIPKWCAASARWSS